MAERTMRQADAPTPPPAHFSPSDVQMWPRRHCARGHGRDHGVAHPSPRGAPAASVRRVGDVRTLPEVPQAALPSPAGQPVLFILEMPGQVPVRLAAVSASGEEGGRLREELLNLHWRLAVCAHFRRRALLLPRGEGGSVRPPVREVRVRGEMLRGRRPLVLRARVRAAEDGRTW